MPPTIDVLALTDEPEVWQDAGFTVDDDGTCRLGLVRLALGEDGRHTAGSPDPHHRGRTGLVRWTLRDFAPIAATSSEIDGIPTAASARPPEDPAAHPNGAIRIDHLVLTSGDGERTRAALEAAGFDLRRVRDVPGGATPMQQRFFRAGEVILELVAAADPAPPEQERPARLYGLALISADLDATVAYFGGACNPAKEAVQPGRRIATLRTRELGISVPIAFMTP